MPARPRPEPQPVTLWHLVAALGHACDFADEAVAWRNPITGAWYYRHRYRRWSAGFPLGDFLLHTEAHG